MGLKEFRAEGEGPALRGAQGINGALVVFVQENARISSGFAGPASRHPFTVLLLQGLQGQIEALRNRDPLRPRGVNEGVVFTVAVAALSAGRSFFIPGKGAGAGELSISVCASEETKAALLGAAPRRVAGSTKAPVHAYLS